MKIYAIFPDNKRWRKECIEMEGGFNNSVENPEFMLEISGEGIYFVIEWGPDE